MSPLHLIFVALVWRTAAAAAPKDTGTLTYVSSTHTSITMKLTDDGGFEADMTYSVKRTDNSATITDPALTAAELTGETEKEITDDKTPALQASEMVQYTITKGNPADTPTATETVVTKTYKFCTLPEALKSVTEAKDADGTTLVLTVVTGEGKTTGVYIDDLSTALTDSPTVALEDGTDAGDVTDLGSGKKWQLKFKTQAAASGTYKVTMPKFPDPAPTYTVKPYFNDATGPCEEDAIGEAYSVANKVSMEGMFVYGVVGLMALILRALGLESYGLF